MILACHNLSKSFGDQVIVKDGSFHIENHEKAALVGLNGAGKSTILKMIVGQLSPDAGTVVLTKGKTLGDLAQHQEMESGNTIYEEVRTAKAEVIEMEKQIRTIEIELPSLSGDALEARLATYQRLTSAFEHADGYAYKSELTGVLKGLGFTEEEFTKPVDSLSGGQKTRVSLGKLLLTKPDVLLLDEPTNFLDKEHVVWLAEYLSSLQNAFMVVSHDYEFLEKISTRICDIDNQKITKYFGTYYEFRRKKALLREDYIRQYVAQQKTIKKTEEFIRKNIAGRKSKMARGRQKQLDRMDKMEAMEQKEIKPHFKFPAAPLTTTEHLRVKHLDVGYHYPVLSDINFSVKGGEKVVITGFNGIGKSTMFKTLVNQIPSLGGNFHFSEQVKIGYFEQDLTWSDTTKTPIQIVSDAYPSLVIKDVRKRLAGCGISSKHAMQEISTLSGGEQAKVKICLLMMKPCNFLIMDEPTNHLDTLAKEALRTALLEFEGTVILVSHEEAFYRDWVQKVINVEKKI